MKRISKNFILFAFVVAITFMGISFETNFHFFGADEKAQIIVSPTTRIEKNHCMTEETTGQRTILGGAERFLGNRNVASSARNMIIYLCIAVILPELLIKTRSIWITQRERCMIREKYIILYMHNLDGRKR